MTMHTPDNRQYPQTFGHIRAKQRPQPQPVEREVVEVTTKEVREKCQKCGRLVIFENYNRAHGLRYVRCPECGGKHALDDEADTIKLLK